MGQRTDLLEIIEHIEPAGLDYQEWLNVGMALKHEGYPLDAWDRWSMADKRYHKGECEKKWNTFQGCPVPVTAGTIVQMAMEHGWNPSIGSRELDWDDEVSTEGTVVDPGWVEERSFHEPKIWDPAKELTRYLEVLFEAGENVGYVTGSWKKTDEDGYRWLPQKGSWDRTAGQLIEALNHCGGDIGAVLGDYNQEAGAWIRFNPLDGKGCKNENVTEFRYALVESDSMDLEKQNAIIRELELPVACLVYSGKKSLHAIVRVDAGDYKEYRERVDYLYQICQKNGLRIDTQNKNPSRLSRMPGVIRNGRKQYIVDIDIGKDTWAEWKEWIEGINDDLPDLEPLKDVWDDLPDLAEPLIDDVLRKGHKMLIAGPSKAGKSFALIELCIAIAEGKQWMRWQCARGKVLYVNLELDRASCLHRFKDVYEALGWQPESLKNIDIWNLRGKAVPMDRLAPKLIRRAAKKEYAAIIIDPIYKVITGDENSADQMSNFCNQFDKVCTELGCAVIYCHHHSKGSQGGKKSMDRASGSGVFARDPDAMLDLIELEITEGLAKQEENKAVCDACARFLDRACEGWEDDVSQDDMCSQAQMLSYCKKRLTRSQYSGLEREIDKAKGVNASRTAWRIEGTLREFPKFQPVSLWFDYPIHKADVSGALQDIRPNEEKAPWERGAEKNRKSARERREERRKSLEEAIERSSFEEEPTVKEVANFLGVSDRTARDRIKEHGKYIIEDGFVKMKHGGEDIK